MRTDRRDLSASDLVRWCKARGRRPNLGRDDHWWSRAGRSRHPRTCVEYQTGPGGKIDRVRRAVAVSKVAITFRVMTAKPTKFRSPNRARIGRPHAEREGFLTAVCANLDG